MVKGGPGQHEVRMREENGASKVQADSQSWCQALREGFILPESCRREKEGRFEKAPKWGPVAYWQAEKRRVEE